MSSIWGNAIKISIFGESHGPGIGVILDGLPSGFTLDLKEINREMKRRAPGTSDLATARKEEDIPEMLSGYFKGKTTGTPLAAFIRNNDIKSKDYSQMEKIMRPSHADYTGYMRYKGFNDYRGSGHFSGRITAPLVFAGAICKQILAQEGVTIGAHIKSMAHILDKSFDEVKVDDNLLRGLSKEELPLLDKSIASKMKDLIQDIKEEGDSVGGIIECIICGLESGLGNPFFDSVESTLAHLMFSIPAIKGIEFGAGFSIASMKGSEANDSYYYEENQVKTRSNHNGGIIGGITNGMPILFRVAVKPTPSIAKRQKTINIETKEETTLEIKGRHDPTILPRIIPVVEAAAAIGVLDIMMSTRGEIK